MKIAALLIIFLLLLVILVYGINSVTAGSTDVTPSPIIEQTTQEIVMPGSKTAIPPQDLPISARVLQQYYSNPEIQTQVVNGIDFSVANFRYLEDDYFQTKIRVDICHSMPDDEKEWHLYDAAIQAGEQRFLAHGFVLLEEASTVVQNGMRIVDRRKAGGSIERNQVPADSIPPYRCDTVDFFPYPSLAKGVDWSHLTLIVKSLRGLPRTGEDRCKFLLTEVQQALNRDGIGIEVACSEADEWGNIRPLVSKIPVDMSQEEAMQIIWSYEEKLLTMEGPWIFIPIAYE